MGVSKVGMTASLTDRAAAVIKTRPTYVATAEAKEEPIISAARVPHRREASIEHVRQHARGPSCGEGVGRRRHFGKIGAEGINVDVAIDEARH